jgi:hypothetical protein
MKVLICEELLATLNGLRAEEEFATEEGTVPRSDLGGCRTFPPPRPPPHFSTGVYNARFLRKIPLGDIVRFGAGY